MQKDISLKLKPSEASNEAIVKAYIARSSAVDTNQVTGYYITRHSIDARSKQQVWINLSVKAFINEPFHQRQLQAVSFKDVHSARNKVIIIGAGPAGLFAALQLIEKGIQPIILERGKDVRARRRDLAALNKEGIVNPDSNYCFGEGGAGTYSDGKLYTRSNKRGNITRILNLFVQFGADERILYETHPHIGTNKLPHIITAMRQQIIDCGGLFLFEHRVTDFIVKDNELKGVIVHNGDSIYADSVILATGHSARDIFHLLHNKKIIIEAKPFALGVRIEHPQSLIDSIQYHCAIRDEHLPPSSYSLVEQVNRRGVFSFCMCPGGIIAPAATAPEELVVNGWSPSKRNNPFANSGMVVSIELKDAMQFMQHEIKNNKAEIPNTTLLERDAPLALMLFQQSVERRAFAAGGGKFRAPAQRVADFCTHKTSATLPDCSYLPGVIAADMNKVLPSFVHTCLQEGIKAFGKKMKGYYTNDAVVVATESRTSSPVRIPRNPDTLEHIQIKNLYPCGEGAGYAGGIISAAMDGEKVAAMIVQKLAGA
ncbi:MAG: FAD-binding protein [Bacteroidota bacterium]|nr:FAD-binding protein [Bacteroidota bacterium]